jgi:hypothetical protein
VEPKLVLKQQADLNPSLYRLTTVSTPWFTSQPFPLQARQTAAANSGPTP